MTAQDPLDQTDYSLHTDEQLRQAIQQVDEQEARVAVEDSGDALHTARRQRSAMQAELARREQP